MEKVQILEGPEKGYCEAVVKLFDVRLHCANSPCDQTTRLPQHLGKVQKRDTARLLRNFLVLKTIAISASGPSYNVYLVGKL